MRYHTQRLYIYSCLALQTALVIASAAMAGPNDYFGQTLPNGQSIQDTDGRNMAPPVGGLAAPGSVGATDYTDDEKRMQKKYRANVAHAHDLVKQGEHMMKGRKEDDKTYKKGKIKKEIGEKQLVDLKTNNPFANDEPRPTKGGKKAEL